MIKKLSRLAIPDGDGQNHGFNVLAVDACLQQLHCQISHFINGLLNRGQSRQKQSGDVASIIADNLEVFRDSFAIFTCQIDDRAGIGIVGGKNTVDFGVFFKDARSLSIVLMLKSKW